jgi:uncharacterized protein
MTEPFYSLRRFLTGRFGPSPIRKLPLQAGFTCPNRDGTLSSGGCLFCDERGAGPLTASDLTLTGQIDWHLARYPAARFIAYFQAFSNTYGPPETLRATYALALRYPEIIAIAIGTRPDTIAPEALAVLADISRQRFLLVELGLQSMHERSLQFLRRHHTFDQFADAVQRLNHEGIAVVAHVIVGIPGESRDDMLATIRALNRLQVAGIKLHPLHVLRGTALADLYARGEIRLLEEAEYLDHVAALLEELDPRIVVHRLTGDREQPLFVAPEWCLNKAKTLARLRRRMQETGAYQGRLFKAE